MIVAQFNCNNDHIIYFEASLVEANEKGHIIKIIAGNTTFLREDLDEWNKKGFFFFIQNSISLNEFEEIKLESNNKYLKLKNENQSSPS